MNSGTILRAKDKLGMEQQDAFRIVDAADYSYYETNQELVALRAQLLDACGLKEA